MLRTHTLRSLPERFSTSLLAGSRYGLAHNKLDLAAARRPQAIVQRTRLVSASTPRFTSTKRGIPEFDKPNEAEEKKLAGEKLQQDKENVTTSSSVRGYREFGQEDPSAAREVSETLRADASMIKEAVALKEVPRDAYYLGMAGVLPYLATSCSTVYLTYCINHAPRYGAHLLLSPHYAHEYLALLEPIQIGFGASIISFLGAIHWGLEFAAYGGRHGNPRYIIGVLAPAVSWPTMLMPIEYALITQFVAFTSLYFADARATKRGYAPPWYNTYRFVLTFITGLSIVVSLIGRGQIAQKDTTLPEPAERVRRMWERQSEMKPEDAAAQEHEVLEKNKKKKVDIGKAEKQKEGEE